MQDFTFLVGGCLPYVVSTLPPNKIYLQVNNETLLMLFYGIQLFANPRGRLYSGINIYQESEKSFIRF